MGSRLIVTRHWSLSWKFTHLRYFINSNEDSFHNCLTTTSRIKAFIIFTTYLSLSLSLCLSFSAFVVLVSVFICLLSMENPLLSGESSRATAAGRKREHQNRSEAIAYGSNFEKAAALVDLVRFILCFTFLMYPTIHFLSLLRKCLFFGVC